MDEWESAKFPGLKRVAGWKKSALALPTKRKFLCLIFYRAALDLGVAGHGNYMAIYDYQISSSRTRLLHGL